MFTSANTFRISIHFVALRTSMDSNALDNGEIAASLRAPHDETVSVAKKYVDVGSEI